MSAYRFDSAWHVPGTVETVWAVIDDLATWPMWWPAVKAVEVLEPGDAAEVGRVARFTLRAPLGYGLAVSMRTVEVAAPTLVVAEIAGQLAGRGRWRLTPEPGGVRIDQLWEVEATRAWMRLLGPVARPAFRWSHDRAARRGGEGLAALLAERV